MMILPTLVLLFSSLVQAKPFIFGQSPNYRLPDNCTPSNYKLHLSFPNTVFNGKTSAYDGKVTITFNCSSDTSNLRLHLSNEHLTVSSMSVDGQKIDPGNYSVDPSIDQLNIIMPDTIASGNTSKLSITFKGTLSKSNLGLYRKSYVENNRTLYFVTTKFEPNYARTMFPCFDEPLFRAIFSFSVTYPSNIKAYFNTEVKQSSGADGITTDTFKNTPPMPPYLLAIMLSSFNWSPDPMYRIISRSSVASSCEYASENLQSILRAYEDLTGFSYREMINKLDALVVPDYAIGGMEHWGMISFSEDVITYSPQEDSIMKEEEVFLVMVHEIAHQWFGDLVSIEWWSENYLKEGLAQYFQYFMSHELHPEWEMDKRFILEMVHLTMQADIRPNGKPINSEVLSSFDMQSKLGGLTYEKGASIFNMVKNFMGEANFKNGLKQYINKHKFKGVTAANLWDDLNDHIFREVSHLTTDLNEVMNNWVGRPGYPVIYVQRKGNDVLLSQQRFLEQGEDFDSKWYVPITQTVSTQLYKFRKTTPDHWLLPSEDLLIPLVDSWKWIILNTNATGLYRVNYEDSIWEAISKALTEENFDGIPELNRAQILDDLFTFAQIDKTAYSKVFRTMEFLKNDASYYPWKTALGHLERLQKRPFSPALRNVITQKLVRLIEQFYNTVPLTQLKPDDHMYVTKQLLAVEGACSIGQEDCVTHIVDMFRSYADNKVRIDKNLKDLVLCNGIRYSNDSSDWDLLWNAFKTANKITEKEMMLEAIGCGRDVDLLNKYLLIALNDEEVKTDDLELLLSKSFENNPGNVDTILKFLLENYEKIVDRFNDKLTWRIKIMEIAVWLSTEDQINRLDDFKKGGKISEVDMDIVTEAIQLARQNQHWSQKHTSDLEQYFGLKSGTMLARFNLAFLVICILSVKLF